MAAFYMEIGNLTETASTTVLFGEFAALGVDAGTFHGGNPLARGHRCNLLHDAPIQSLQLFLSLRRSNKAIS